MSAVRLAILGAGNIRCSPPVITSLAVFFGERPLEITLYDADGERLDLFDRFARLCFAGLNSSHSLRATEDPGEAVIGAERLIYQVDENCAGKFIKEPSGSCALGQQAANSLLANLEDDPEVLNLVPNIVLPVNRYRTLDWPLHLSPEEERAMPHYILRCIRQEESIYPMIKVADLSPIVAWLNDDLHS